MEVIKPRAQQLKRCCLEILHPFFSKYTFAHCGRKVQSTGLVSKMHQACLDVPLQTADAEFCGEERRKGFSSDDSSMKVIFVQVHYTVEQCTTTTESAKSPWRSFEVKQVFFLCLFRQKVFSCTVFYHFFITIQTVENHLFFWYFLIVFMGIHYFNFQSARQLLRGAHGCWLFEESGYRALKFASPGLS